MNQVKKYLSGYRILNSSCKRYLWLYMLHSISAGVAFFIAIFLHDFLSFSADIISIIVGFYVVGNLLGSWLSAKLIDKNKPFKLSALSLIIQGVCFFSICCMTSYLALSIILLILGTASYVYMISSNYLITWLAGTEEKHRASAISLQNVFSNVGLGLGGVIVSYLSRSHSIFMFVSVGTLLIMSGIIYLFYQSKELEVFEENSTDKLSLPNLNLYRLSLVIVFFLGFIFAQQRVSYSLFLKINFGGSGAGFIFFLNSILIIFFLPTVTKYAVNTNQIISMGVGTFLLGVGMLLLGVASSFFFVVVICFITTLGEMLSTTLSQLICFQSVSTEKRGKAMGYYKFFYASGTIIGTLVGGKIQVTLDSNYVWITCGIIGVLALVLSYHFSESKNKIKLLPV